MTFWADVKVAAYAALLVGIKILVIAGVVLIGLGWALNDYLVTRQKAAAAFDFAQRVVQQQQQQQQQRQGLHPEKP